MKDHPKDFQERIDAIMEIDAGHIGDEPWPGGRAPVTQLDRVEAKLDLLLKNFGLSLEQPRFPRIR